MNEDLAKVVKALSAWSLAILIVLVVGILVTKDGDPAISTAFIETWVLVFVGSGIGALGIGFLWLRGKREGIY